MRFIRHGICFDYNGFSYQPSKHLIEWCVVHRMEMHCVNALIFALCIFQSFSAFYCGWHHCTKYEYYLERRSTILPFPGNFISLCLFTFLGILILTMLIVYYYIHQLFVYHTHIYLKYALASVYMCAVCLFFLLFVLIHLLSPFALNNHIHSFIHFECIIMCDLLTLLYCSLFTMPDLI